VKTEVKTLQHNRLDAAVFFLQNFEGKLKTAKVFLRVR